MSDSDGFTPNHLLQQMYGTQIVDEDIDLELSDEELELIAGIRDTCMGCESTTSDIFYDDKLIIDYHEFKTKIQTDRTDDDQQEIDYFKEQFKQKAEITIHEDVARELWQQLRAQGAVDVKIAHKGFRYNPNWKPGSSTRILEYIE